MHPAKQQRLDIGHGAVVSFMVLPIFCLLNLRVIQGLLRVQEHKKNTNALAGLASFSFSFLDPKFCARV